MDHIYADLSTSISEFKRNPAALIKQAGDQPVAILIHNKPTSYLLPARLYEKMLEALENKELIDLAQNRLSKKEKTIRVDLDEL